MTQPIPNRTPRRGRIFPEIQWTEAEKAKRKSESEAFYQRCRTIFKQIRPELIGEHYGWYIAIEPDSKEYFIDPDRETAHHGRRRESFRRCHARYRVYRVSSDK